MILHPWFLGSSYLYIMGAHLKIFSIPSNETDDSLRYTFPSFETSSM